MKSKQTNEQAEHFLTELYKHIERINSKESAEITNEIKSHIYDSLHAGNTIENILQRLGDPKILAKAYVADYQLNHKKMTLSPLISVLKLGSLGLVGAILLPTLFFVSALFIVLAIIIIGIAITNLLRITQIPLMVLSSSYMLTGFPQFISSIIVCIVMIIIGLGLLTLIQKYCKFVINKYKLSILA